MGRVTDMYRETNRRHRETWTERQTWIQIQDRQTWTERQTWIDRQIEDRDRHR